MNDSKSNIKMLNDSGVSIIEVLVAAVLISILSVAVMNLVANQNKELNSLSEKMSLQSSQTLITNLFSGKDYCSCFLKPHSFDYDNKIWNSFPNTIFNGFDTTCNPIGTALLTVGVRSENILPIEMSLKNIVETTGNSGNFSADLEIKMDQNLLSRARKDLKIPIYFSVKMSDPSNARSLNSCASNSSSLLSNDPISVPVNIPRKGSNSVSTGPNQYQLCFLSGVQSGGDDGGGGDRCEVTYDSFSRVWTVSGTRGDDPPITCRMYCIPQ